MWDVGSVSICREVYAPGIPGGCVYKLVCHLAGAVMYEVLEQMAAPSIPPRPTSAHLTLLLRGNEGSSSLEPGGRSNKRH